MKMNCIRLSATMQIDAENVSFLNMTYIQTFELFKNFLSTGCKPRFYADPYKTLNKNRFMV